MVSLCNLCQHRILSHSCYLSCACCHGSYHIQCLPNVSKVDSLYSNRLMDKWFCPKCLDSVFPFNNIADEFEFIDALSELWIKEINVSLAELCDKLFNPFEINEDTNVSPLFDIDPDLQYYNTICNRTPNKCDYYLEDTFIKKCSHLPITSECFSILHTNIRSLPKHI